MAFSTHLEFIVKNVDGAIACTVMGFDGIPIETHQAPALANTANDLELANAWVEYANVLSTLKTAAETLKTGAVSEISVNTDKVLTLIRMVSPEFFIVLGLKPEGNYGKGRYVMRITAPKVKAEL